jgi:NADH-quinone oxidoreductase subunit J
MALMFCSHAAAPTLGAGLWAAAAPVLMGPMVSPVVILALCIIAGVGTVMLLPGREANLTRIGGIVVLASLLILAALVVRYTSSNAPGRGMGVYFWVFSLIALYSALRVVTHPRPVYSALYFVLTVLASAGLFLLLWAEFMAAALVVIYAGAILVTYVFVIMLAQQSQSPVEAKPLAGLAEYDVTSRDPVAAAAVGFVLMGILLFVTFDKATALAPKERAYTVHFEKNVDGGPIQVSDEVDAASPDAARAIVEKASGAKVESVEQAVTAQALGRYLFENQLVNLELAGLILTLSMVGAIVIARRRVVAGEGEYEPTTEVLTGPATPVDDNPHSIPVYGTDNPRAKAYPET